MTGNLTDAARALAYDGEIIGEGSSRIVFRINDIVYKVLTYDDVYFNANAAEYENISTFVDNEMVRVPRSTYFDDIDVIAMEYVEGTPVGECYCLAGEKHYRCLTPIEREIIADTGMTDMSYGNIIRDNNGMLNIIDFGE